MSQDNPSSEGAVPDGHAVGELRSADNGAIREHRARVREMVSLLKAVDKDLQTLASYNTHDENLTMTFNDSDLDEVQRMSAARGAVSAWVELARLAGESSLLTGSKR